MAKKHPDEVAGIKLAAVKPEVLKQCMKDAGLSVEGTLEQLIERMSEHITEQGGELADCDVCGGECDVSKFTICPYCGVGEDDEAPAALTPKPPVADSAKVEPLKDGDGAKTPLASLNQKLKKRGAKEPAPKAPEKKPAPLAKSTEKLDAAVKQVKTIQQKITADTQTFGRTVMGDHWELGNALYTIFKDNLYALRVDAATGVPRHKSWGQFVIGELGMSTQQAYKLMNVATQFSRKQVEEYGISKLKHLVRLPEAERNELLEDVAKRLPESELAKEVRERAKKTGGAAPPTVADRKREVQPTAGGPRKGSKAAAEKKKPRPLQDKVTIAALLTRQTVPLYVKGSAEKRAKRIGDEPTGREEVLNGVVCTYKLAMHSAGLVLIVERKREVV
jgi:hypothetical protein